MIWLLRIAFSFVLASMLSMTTWASLNIALWNTPHEVVSHPWFIATLFDAYFAFLTFYAWVAYKETSHVARVIWLIAILLLGNIAMASYMLMLLFRLPASASFEQILLRKPRAS